MSPSEISKLREASFRAEELGNLGKFYRDTAKVYKERFLQETKQLEQLRTNWESTFLAAEETFRSGNTKKFLPRFMDPISKKAVLLSSVLDMQTGQRKTFEEILKGDTSKRGNIFDMGQLANNFLESSRKVSDYEKSYSSYEQNFANESSLLEKRNEEARKIFLDNKAKKLSALEASAYRQPTYTENPL